MYCNSGLECFSLSVYDTLVVTSCCLCVCVCVCGLFVFLSLCSSALKHFTTGLQADPTYVRALMCKAEAHTELNQVHTPIHTVCNLSLSLFLFSFLSLYTYTCTFLLSYMHLTYLLLSILFSLSSSFLLLLLLLLFLSSVS